MFRKTFTSAVTFGLAHALSISDHDLETNSLAQLANKSQNGAITEPSVVGFVVTPVTGGWVSVSNAGLKGKCSAGEHDYSWAEKKTELINTQIYMDHAEKQGYHGFVLHAN